jgi:D-glycero-beta-D-manno-heptose 1-phosphate adenylyltransferase
MTTRPLQEFLSKKIIDPAFLQEKVASIRREKKSIATINGSFDLLHAGHLYILFEASRAADVLICALNSDGSIKKYKSPDRPIIPLKYRLDMMAAIQFVDYVTWFEETDPRAILEKIRPDFHINGAEYGAECIEAETVRKNGGKLVLVDRIDGLSTTEITKKIIQVCGSSGPQNS